MKRSKTIPLILLLYLIGISIYAWPGRNHGISYSQYWLTIGITLVCIIILSYLFRRRDKMRNKMKNEK